MKNKKGEKHFTASAWILTKSNPKKMLLVFHKKFNRWIQPGGHIEKFENPVEAVIREVKEETGIDISFLLNKTEVVDHEGSFLANPDFLMEQTIPPHKNESEHYHLDLNYVVKVSEQKLKPSEHESREVGWFTKDEIQNLSTHQDTKVIVERIM